MKEEEICSPTTQGSRNITIGTYLYDETDRMVQGTNKDGEASLYTFNGLGVRVGSELILEDNTHGYTDFHCLTPSIETTVGGPQGPEVVKADYVIDYTRLNIDQRVLMKLEEGGYDFRYVYGLDKIQVTVNSEGSNWWGQNIKPCVMMNYVHTDRLGSVVNLSDQYGRVTARVDYDDWGKVTAYTDITVDGGFRRLLPEITYATHDYDSVLELYYAKARFYDAHDRRFTVVDPILDPSGYDLREYTKNPVQFIQYLYVSNNPLIYTDPLGMMVLSVGGEKNNLYTTQIENIQIALEYLGYLTMPCDSEGNKVAYGTYGGASAGGVQFFKFNYGYSDYGSGTITNNLYLTIMNKYVNVKYANASQNSREFIFNLYRQGLMEADKYVGYNLPDYYYLQYRCEIPKDAELSKAMKDRGVKLKTDFGTKDNIIRLDLSIPADAMLDENAMISLEHRFRSYEEVVQYYKDNFTFWGYLIASSNGSISNAYLGEKGAAANWYLSMDGDDKPWDIKRRAQFEEQMGIPYMGQQTLFYYNGVKMNAENLGNYAYGYWASLVGFTESEIRTGSYLEAKLTNMDDTGDDLDWILKGIQAAKIDYPQYVRSKK